MLQNIYAVHAKCHLYTFQVKTAAVERCSVEFSTWMTQIRSTVPVFQSQLVLSSTLFSLMFPSSTNLSAWRECLEHLIM